MKTLKVLSLLLSYPSAELLASVDALDKVVRQEALLPAAEKNKILAFIDEYRNHDLFDLQEQYCALFDRGRYLSLHIFEHVHGESRDRGQAMVDLMAIYEAAGFEIATRELPDYIPLFLEFLSEQQAEEAKALLHDAMPVLSLLGARLAERASSFQVIFDALAAIAGEPEMIESIRRRAATETPDDTLVNMDAIWEEEVVSFMDSGSACREQRPAVSPVTVMPRSDFLKAQAGCQ